MFPYFPVDSARAHSAIAVGFAEFGSVTAFSHNPKDMTKFIRSLLNMRETLI